MLNPKAGQLRSMMLRRLFVIAVALAWPCAAQPLAKAIFNITSATSAPITTQGATLLTAFVTSNSDTPATVQDSENNNWTKATSIVTASGYGSFALYYASGPGLHTTSGTTHTLTVSGSSLTYTCEFAAWSGYGALDQVAVDTYNYRNPQFASITPSGNGYLILSGLAAFSNSGGYSVTVPLTSYSEADYVYSSGVVNYGFAAGYLYQSTGAAVTASWTLGNLTTFSDVIMASFQPVSGGGGATDNTISATGNLIFQPGSGYNDIFSQGKVGIGTSSPQSLLSVNGGVAIGSYASTTTAPSGNVVVSGSVGIGTASPGAGYSLDVESGKINSSGGYCINGASCITSWPSGGAGSGTVTSISAGAGLSGGTITTSGSLALDTTHANSWTGVQNFSGVGIGTTNPAVPFQVGPTLTSPFGIVPNQLSLNDTPVGPSATAIASEMLTVQPTGSSFGGEIIGNFVEMSTSASSSGQFGSFLGSGSQVDFTGGGTVANLVGGSVLAENSGAASVTEISGFRANGRNTGNGSVTTVYGGDFRAQNNQSSGTGTVTNEYGIQSFAGCFSTNTCTNQYGLYAFVANQASSTTQNAYAGYLDFGSNANTPTTATITNGYGLYLGTMAGTHKWSLYSADQSASSYFAGNVGIGTGVTNPVHPLQVNGTIGATEVVVSSTGADYVFDADYKLSPLSDVEEYVKENHHLPDIPSALEVAANGISVGEMQSKLLAKIEELTLHLIELDRKNKSLEQDNRSLNQEVQEIRKLLGK